MTIPALGPIDWILHGVTFANLALALLVLRHAPRREVNRVFAVTGAAVALWTLTNALFRVAASQRAGIFWAELSYGAAILLGASFLHFSWIYPTRTPFHYQHSKYVLWLCAVSLFLLSFVPGALLKDVMLDEQRIVTAPGVWLLFVFILATSGLAFRRFWHSQARLHGGARDQARYVLFGAGLTAAFGLLFNLFLPLAGNYHWVWAGPVSSIFFVGFTVYSIVAHHLFDIDVLIHRTVVYSLLLAIVAVAFSGVEMALTSLVGLVVGEDNPYVAHLFTALIVSLGIQPLRHQLERTVRRFLFRREAARGKVARHVSGVVHH